MNPRENILNELREFNSSLPSETAPNPYAVPQGYFEGLADAVLAKIKGENPVSSSDEIAELSPLLAGLSRKIPYAVPAGFFESTDLSSVTEEERLPEILARLDKTMPFEVPAGYFETLPEIVLGRVATPKARVVSMSRRWMRYAAAAVITGVIAISGWVYFNNKPASVSVDNPEWVATKLKDVETKELEQFIEQTDVTIAQNKPKTKTTNTTEAESLLKDVSNEELSSFLDEVPVEDEEVILLN
jgi:hypothetical protein